jgi:hypothetical protein
MKLTALGIVAALYGPLTGCAVQGHPPLVVQCSAPAKGDRSGPALVGQEYGTQATPIPLNSVQFSNWDTVKELSVQRLFAARTSSNTVQVTARFISCADTVLAIRVRTSFLDANQAPTEPASAWQTVFLQPRLTTVYAEKSTSQSVANYLIEIAPI